ncbi:AbiTii domain-containing protein [Peribacillus muralis]|uniref:AbiTii domain-containing protein n=1 Tax=Peribacillus muralis TaxID=264697 RepID=UPI00366FDF68
MDLIAQLQNDVIDTNNSISTALRRAQVLAYHLKIDEFKNWVENELNGYKDKLEKLPDYRRCRTVIIKGNFSGTSGIINNVEIPLSHLSKYKTESFREIHLFQGIKAYESLIEENSGGIFSNHIPVDVAMAYFSDVYQGMQCISARKEFPKSALVELLDTVRNRLLSFVLELQSEFPNLTSSDEKLRDIPSERAQSIFHYYIYGDNSIISSGQDNDIKIQQNVVQNDIETLIKTLTSLGVSPEEIHTLEESITDDERQPGRGIGPKTKKWIEYFKQKADDGIPQILIDLTLKAIASYYGIPI